jgi:proton-dependent oligopeptide transporter, POT family
MNTLENQEADIQALKQPKVFHLAWATAICERFGFYVLSFLLVYYTKNELQLSDKDAFALFAAFTALAYITPALGGYLADHVFGIRRAIVMGLFLEASGLVCLIFEQHFIFTLGLALLVVGVGFFKTGPTNLMARSYVENDPRVDSGFTLYYMSINVGSLISSFVATALFAYQHVAFGGAAVIVYASIIMFLMFATIAGKHESKVGLCKFSLAKWFLLILGTLVALGLCVLLLYFLTLANLVFVIATVVLGLYFLFEILKSPTEEKKKIIACLFFIACGFIFFLMYFQLYESVALFIERCVSHKMMGFNIKASIFFGGNAFWILVLSPVLAWMYEYLGKEGKDLSITTKFPLGLLITSAFFFILVYAAKYTADSNSIVSGWWIYLALFFYSLGELFVSALSFAMISKIAPQRLYGVMMGAWFLIASALASSLSGRMADWASISDAIIHKPDVVLHVYAEAFLKMGIIGLIAAIVVFILGPYVKRMASLD